MNEEKKSKIKYRCKYRNHHYLKIGDDYKKGIIAANPKEAYETFIGKVGVYPQKVFVGYKGGYEEFDNHIKTDEKILNELVSIRGEVSGLENRMANLKWILIGIGGIIFFAARF